MNHHHASNVVVQTTPHLTRREFLRFVSLMRNPHFRDVLPEICLNQYLSTVAIAYRAVFANCNWVNSVSRYTRSRLPTLSLGGADHLVQRNALDQYRALADGRHGGLLDLPPDDCIAFETWYHSQERWGAHPFEILAGDNNFGVMLRVDLLRDGRNGWEYQLSVHAREFCELAARMAILLDRARVPFEFKDPAPIIGHIALRCSRS